MSTQNLHDRVARTSLLKRVENLRADRVGLWGRMSVGQMVWHLNEGLRMATGELPVPSKGYGPLKRAVFKLVVFNMPWPKGKAQTAPALMAREEHDLAAELRRFPMLLEQVAMKDVSGPWPSHPLLGEITGPEWSRLGYLHIDHHLRQFGA